LVWNSLIKLILVKQYPNNGNERVAVYA